MIYDNHLDTPQTLQARTKGTYEKPPERSRNPYNTKGRREGTKDKPLGPSQLTGTRSRGAYDKPLGQSVALIIRPQKQMTYDNHLDAKKGDTPQTCRPLLHHRNKEAEGIRQTSRAVTSPAQYEPVIKLHMSVV